MLDDKPHPVRAGNRRWFLKGTTALVSAGATFGAAELIARSVFQTSFLDRAQGLAGGSSAALDNVLSLESMHETLTSTKYPLGMFQYNSHLQFSEHTRRFFWAPRGPIAGHKVHALGYTVPRDHDYESFEPGGLMAGGCSCTYGSNVAREHTFSNVAGRELGLDAYNFGMASYSYVTMLHQLEDLIERGVVGKLKPRRYVLGAGSWLDYRSTTPFYPTFSFQLMFPYVDGTDARPEVVRPSEEYTFRRLLELQAEYFPTADRHVALTSQRRSLLQPMRERILEVQRKQAAFRRTISPEGLCQFILPRLHRLCEEQGMEMSVLWIPAKEHPADSIEEMQAVCSRIGCQFVDGNRVWNEYGLDPKTSYHADAHPGENLHIALGKLLARELGA